VRSLRIDIAVGPGSLVALIPGGDGVVRVATALEPGMDDPGPALRQGLGRLEDAIREQLGIASEAPVERVRVRVALLPPFCEARLVALPPLRPEEILSVLQRDSGRHFLARHRPIVVGGARLGDDQGPDGLPPVLAAAASGTFVRILQAALESRGWGLDRIVPAPAAWFHALRSEVPLPPGGGDGGSESAPIRLVVAVLDGMAHLVRASGGAPDRIRRVRADALDELVAAAGAEPGWCLLLAEGEGRGGEGRGGEGRAAIAAALKEAGWVIARAGESELADVAAARHLADAEPELVPIPLALARRARNRRLAVTMLAAAVVIVAAAGVVHLWGTAREYGAIQQARAELREDVAPALAARDSLDRINERLEDLQAVGRASARWTYSLVELSMLLPIESHVVSLRAAGDTVVIEAAGGRAGDALAALSRAPSLRDVRLEGTIQRDLERGTTSRERFTLSAILSESPPASTFVTRPGPDDEERR
jgi:hypothetical protein